jgi:hypothetical protein
VERTIAFTGDYQEAKAAFDQAAKRQTDRLITLMKGGEMIDYTHKKR